LICPTGFSLSLDYPLGWHENLFSFFHWPMLGKLLLLLLPLAPDDDIGPLASISPAVSIIYKTTLDPGR
jgi:hypothetical protein